MALLKNIVFRITKGMSRDFDEESSSNETAFELYNIKVLKLDENGNNALINEKGTSKVTIDGDTIYGDVIGCITCDSNISVIFTKSSTDIKTSESKKRYIIPKNVTANNFIYKLEYKNQTCVTSQCLAIGNFNFGDLVDGIFCYENSKIQKIYWIDGVNLLRYLNIANDDLLLNPILDLNKLNSTPSFKFNHHIEVEKLIGGGTFTAGVILYAFTYFNKYGAETNLVDMTPLYYITEEDRGMANSESVGCSFKVTIKGYDNNFDYIRLYSIQRTSINGLAIVKIVKDIKLN